MTLRLFLVITIALVAAAGAEADGTNPPPWSLIPPVRRAAPAVPREFPPAANAIDRFIQARLATEGLPPSGEADRRTLIRRLSFDLLGLPPAPEEVASFVADPDPAAYERLVERYLASPHFGERWGRHWLDVVRFAESNGFEMNQPRDNAWRYRDWVIQAFNTDLPYDRFVTAQLAGDLLGDDAATGFLVAGAWDQVKSPDEVLTRNQRADELHDMVSVTGSAFLATTLGCARCHDHKFDPVSQRDYYAVKAMIEGVQHGERNLALPNEATLRQQAAALQKRLAEIDDEIASFEPPAAGDAVAMLDEETGADDRVRELKPHTAKGEYPAGSARGERDDAGGSSQPPTPSPSYLAWDKVADTDVFAWRPGQAGRFQVWVSWGSGWSTHARDAVYVLDPDGDPATRGDQRLLATVDQQHFADGSGEVPARPLWSGFRSLGSVELQPHSAILLRGGTNAAFVSADTLVTRRLAADETASDGPPPLRSLVSARGNQEKFPAVSARRMRFTIESSSGGEPCLDELEVFSADEPAHNVALAAEGTTVKVSGTYPNSELHRAEHVNDGRYGNSRSWISNESGRGWVELTFAHPVRINRVAWARDRNGEFGDRIATRYRIELTDSDTDSAGSWRLVAGSSDRLPWSARPVKPVLSLTRMAAGERDRLPALLAEQARVRTQHNAALARPKVYAGTFREPEPTKRFHRGDPMQPREPVEPSIPVALGGPVRPPQLGASTGEAERRRNLGAWLVTPGHPLTARVIANRAWQHHFGTGLVATPDDFGANGAKPSHPELLDWLALELSDHGWSLKHLHRLIVTSRTYRQTARPKGAVAEQGAARDSGNRLIWRQNVRRLEAEPLRDAVLTTAGNLNPAMGGPSWSPFQPNENYVRVYEPAEELGPGTWRRMVYSFNARSRVDGVFGAFDCPDGGIPAARRASSLTPLQALNFWNSRFLHDQAGYFAARLTALHRPPGETVDAAFQLAFQRPPTPAERAGAVELVRSDGVAALTLALLNANEFVFVE